MTAMGLHLEQNAAMQSTVGVQGDYTGEQWQQQTERRHLKVECHR